MASLGGIGGLLGAPLTMLSSAASVAGDYLQYQGQRETNAANVQQAREQMDFQERMSNTAWQRGVADMRAAGLNPALAYQQGGASSPAGAMATLSNPNAAFGRLGDQVTSSVMAASELQNQAKQREVADADIGVKRAQEANIRGETGLQAPRGDVMRQQVLESQQKIETLKASAAAHVASAAQSMQQVENLRAALPQIEETVKNLRSLTSLNLEKQKLVFKQAGLTEAETQSAYQRLNADLPHMEAAVQKAKEFLLRMQQPQAMNQAGIHETLVGTVSELWKAFPNIIFGR